MNWFKRAFDDDERFMSFVNEALVHMAQSHNLDQDAQSSFIGMMTGIAQDAVENCPKPCDYNAAWDTIYTEANDRIKFYGDLPPSGQ